MASEHIAGLVLTIPIAALAVRELYRRARCRKHGHNWDADAETGGWRCACCKRRFHAY